MLAARTTKTNLIKNLFAAFCFIFVAFLLFVTLYETIVTEELPTSNPQKEQAISDKYSFLPKAFGDEEKEFGLDEDEEFEDEEDKHNKGWYDD